MLGTKKQVMEVSRSPVRERLNEGKESLIKRRLKKLRISRGMRISELRSVYQRLFSIMDRDGDKLLSRSEF